MRKKLLCGVLSLLMFVLAGCSKEDKASIGTEQGVDSVSIKQVEEDTINIDGTDYKKGVYTSEHVILDDFEVSFEITIGDSGFDSIRMMDLNAEITSVYPSLQPTFEEIAKQIITNQSLDDITYSEDSEYTASIILNAINAALEDAKVK